MTLQQLEYLIALDKHKHYVRAAEACGVSQSTLSSMIQKLETELDVTIFDRSSHPIMPTKVGEKIIAQAKTILLNAHHLQKIPINERESEKGSVHIGIIPTIASYITAKLIHVIQSNYPDMRFHIYELTTAEILKKFDKGSLDMAIMATPLEQNKLLEIPLYYEKFIAYIAQSEENLYNNERINPHQLPIDHLWYLKEGHCFRNQVFNFCDSKSKYSAVYEAENLHTLISIVDENGGYTILPELHLQLLPEEKKKNIRRLTDPEPVREVSLVVREDYIFERLLNNVSSAVQKIIPEEMLDKRLKKFAIRL